jgi:hypothetical protein
MRLDCFGEPSIHRTSGSDPATTNQPVVTTPNHRAALLLSNSSPSRVEAHRGSQG